MRKILSVMLLAAVVIFSTHSQAATEFTIDYGKSKIFSKADMDYAIGIIRYELGRSGCTLLRVRYAGDNYYSHENRKYLNSLAESRGFDKKFTKCMVFFSDYMSPPDPHDGKPTAWNYDSEYKDWTWYFGFYKEDGEWKLLSDGY